MVEGGFAVVAHAGFIAVTGASRAWMFEANGLRTLTGFKLEVNREPLFQTKGALRGMPCGSSRSMVKFHCCEYGRRLASTGRYAEPFPLAWLGDAPLSKHAE